MSSAESLISLRTRLWRAFRQSGQRQSGKREGRDPLAERGRLVDSAKGIETRCLADNAKEHEKREGQDSVLLLLEVIKCPTMDYDLAWYGASFSKERRGTVQTWSPDLDTYWK